MIGRCGVATFLRKQLLLLNTPAAGAAALYVAVPNMDLDTDTKSQP